MWRSCCASAGLQSARNSADCRANISSKLVELHRRNVKRFRGALVFEVHTLLNDSALDLREIRKKEDILFQEAL